MKRTFLLLLCLLLMVHTPLSAVAAAPKIVDNAALLTDSEMADLEELANALANRYGIDIVIVTVDSLGGKSSERYADDYYDYNGYGMGDDSSGILLLLSMEYRDWAISTCGEAMYALTDYGVQSVFSEISGYLSQGRYYPAFLAYLDALEPYLEAYRSGSPIDGVAGDHNSPGIYIPGTKDDTVHYEPGRDLAWYLQKIGISLIIGVVAALIAVLIMRSQMNTAKAQHGAASYMDSSTYQIGLQRDIFLYSQLRKVRKSENSSSGGGSSVHRSSSGRSHGGGHGKF